MVRLEGTSYLCTIKEITKAILKKVEKDTGYEVLVSHCNESSLSCKGEVSSKYIDGKKVYFIECDINSKYIDHIIVHECGHLLHTPGCHKYTTDFELHPPAFIKFLRYIKNESAYPIDFISKIYNDLKRYLLNMPKDMKIEKWIHKEYLELRNLQKDSLLEDSVLDIQIVDEMKRTFPYKISNSILSMFVAFWSVIAPIIGEKISTESYGEKANTTGKNLADIFYKNKEFDKISEMWTSELGIRDWFGPIIQKEF